MTNARFITALRRRYSVFPWEKVPSCSNRKKKSSASLVDLSLIILLSCKKMGNPHQETAKNDNTKNLQK